MKNKSIFYVILSALLAIAMIFALASCGGTTTECTEHKDADGDGICDTEGCGKTVEPAPAPSADVFNAEGELILYSGGTPTFQIVRGSDVGTNAKALDELAEILTGLSNTEVKVVGATDATKDVEILVGNVANRGDEYVFNKYSYGLNGYMVKQVGTKIVVIGGSDAALAKAIDYLKSTVFGIKRNNEPFGDFAMKADANYDKPQTGYKTTSIKIDGVSISDYVVYSPKGDVIASRIATNFRDALYENEGIWLEITSKESDAKAIKFLTVSNDGEGEGFAAFVDDSGNVVFECEYGYKFEETATKSYLDKIVSTGKKTLAFNKNQVIDTVDLRNIYYEDFGANGYDTLCDYAAIREAHRIANAYGHTVNADPNATYHIGNNTGSESAVIMTDTNWNGCKFIINDRGLTRSNPEYYTPIFDIRSSVSGSNVEYSDDKIPISELKIGATNIGFAPGFKAIVYVENSNVKQFVRTGGGQNDHPGNPQQEVILVDENGNIDPSTPVQWDYTTVTKVKVIRVDDTPITVSGGAEGVYATFTTIFNGSPYGSYDSYLKRNINVTRSNTTVTNFIHIVEGEDECESGQPYNGFTATDSTYNVTWSGLTLQRYKTWNNTVSGQSVARSYEVRAGHVVNLLYKDCTQSNFFHEPNGGARGNGMMGTNYCRNITLDNCKFNTFDAHCGVYNAAVINSTVVYISLIGQGTFNLEGTTVYATRVDSTDNRAIELRPDYGSSFNGTLIVKDVTIKYIDAKRDVDLMYVSWTDTYRGFKTYLPGSIYLDNVKLVQVKFENEVESVVGENLKPLNIIPYAMATMKNDISDPSLLNPYQGTRNLYITNCGNLQVFIPTSPQFKYLKVHYDADNNGICDGGELCECSGDNFVATVPSKKEEE